MRRLVFGIYTYAEFVFSALLFIPLMGIVALRHGDDPGRRIRGRWFRRFGRFTSRLNPLWRFKVEGDAPADIGSKPYVVVVNHESVADPFLLSYLPWDERFIAKEELFRAPLVGWLMRLGGDIPLRRGDRSSVEQMLEDCRTTLKAGVSVLLFPEGTRSPDGNLLPFKDGAFQIAIEAQVPILPLAIEGTRGCLPKHSKLLGDADAAVRVLEPIPTAGLTRDDLPALKEKTREIIAAAVAEMRAKRGHAVLPEREEVQATSATEA